MSRQKTLKFKMQVTEKKTIPHEIIPDTNLNSW